MNGEFQDRKDIDKLFHDLYRIDGKTANVVKYNEDTKFVDMEGNLQTIDEILSVYYDSGEIDEKIIDAITGGDIDLSDYVKDEELAEILTNYAEIIHFHSQYVERSELSDLDIDLTTLRLVPPLENPNGVMCFEEIQKTIDELDIDLSMDTMSNGYLKINASLIEK